MEKTPIEEFSILQNGRTVHYVAAMEHVRSVKQIIDEWPNREAIAKRLTQILNAPIQTARVHKWAQNNSIPQEFLDPFLIACREEGFNLSADELIKAHSREPAGGNSNGAAA